MKMNLEQMKARLAEIVSQLEGISDVDTFSNEQVEEINGLNEEFATLKNNIEAKEKMEAMKKTLEKGERKTSPSPVAAAPRVEVGAPKMGGFQSAGDFLMAVKRASAGDLDKRFQNTMYEKNGEDGGFLIPDEMSSDIAKKMGGDESLLSRTRQFTISGNSLSLPTDENQPWNGGVQAFWTAEGAPIQDSKHSFGTAAWRLHKVAALVKTTDELLEDAVALESYIRAMAPEAIMHKVNEAILTGNGVGKPSGILTSGFKIKVDKEVGQVADTIVARNVIKMYTRMIPSSRPNAIWVINAQVEEQLRTMKDDEGNFIYLAPGSQLNQTPYGSLMGRPVLPLLGGMRELGTEGDIMFVDFSYYYSILKSNGLKNSVSTHLYFDRDLTAYKFTMRIDGSCPFKNPVTTQYGDYKMSAFVTLEDR
jgi:HK97 family phage major capsid protein